MKNRAKAAPWIVGILVATALFGVCLLWNTVQYSGSDDAPILRNYMGFEGGRIETFSMIVHPAMGWLLTGLAKLFPAVAWFSVFQLFFLWFSSVVVVKSFTRCAALHGRSLWVGAAIGTLAVAVGALWISMRISFTTTAAWLGAAAVAQLASVDWAKGGGRAMRRGMALSTALLICCYLLRQVSVLPPLAFWLLGLALAWLSRRDKGLLKSILAGVAVCAALLLALTGARLLEKRLMHVEETYAWNDASALLLDYSDVDQITPTDEALAAVGWTQAEYRMFCYWYFLDGNMTVENMTALYRSTFANAGQPAGERLQGAVGLIRNAVRGTPSQAYGILFALTAALLCLALAALRGFTGPFVWLGAIAAPLFGALLLLYLGWEGRLPMRAMLSVTLPMLTLCAWQLCRNLEPAPGKGVRNAAALLLCLPLLCPAALGAASAWNESQKALLALRHELSVNETYISEDLDTFAAENPDLLIVYDLTLALDTRLFPRVPEPLAGNALFWGGHAARTPGWQAAFERLGVTQMDASIFLQDNVLLASVNAEPLPELCAYMEAQLSRDVDWQYYDSYGSINFFQFFAL